MRKIIIIGMLSVPLVKVINRNLKIPTPAAKSRINKIKFFVSEHPGCTFSDIYNNGNITRNKEDLRNDIEYQITVGEIIQVSIKKRFFAQPITKQSQNIVIFYQLLDDIVAASKVNPSFQQSEIAQQIKKMNRNLKQSNLGKILEKYRDTLDPKTPVSDKFLSKFWINLLQMGKLISSEAKRTGQTDTQMQIRLNDYYKNQIKLIQKEKKILEEEKLSSDDDIESIKKQRREIRTERQFKRTSHLFEWKSYEQLCQRKEQSLNYLIDFMSLFRMFIQDYDLFSKQLSLDSSLAEYLDQNFDYDKKYTQKLRSARRRSLKELITIWNYILRGCNQYDLALEYGYKNRKVMLRALQVIQDEWGYPDFDKISELKRIEKNRILVPETSDDEIWSFFNNYELHKGAEKMQITFQAKKAKKIIQDHQPRSSTL